MHIDIARAGKPWMRFIIAASSSAFIGGIFACVTKPCLKRNAKISTTSFHRNKKGIVFG